MHENINKCSKPGVLDLWPLGQVQPTEPWNLAHGAPQGLRNLAMGKQWQLILWSVSWSRAKPPFLLPDQAGARSCPTSSVWSWAKPLSTPHSWIGTAPHPSLHSQMGPCCTCPGHEIGWIHCRRPGHCSSAPLDKKADHQCSK